MCRYIRSSNNILLLCTTVRVRPRFYSYLLIYLHLNIYKYIILLCTHIECLVLNVIRGIVWGGGVRENDIDV